VIIYLGYRHQYILPGPYMASFYPRRQILSLKSDTFGYSFMTQSNTIEQDSMESFDPTRIPLGVSPDGQAPRFDDGPSQSWIPRLAIYTTLPLAIASVILRLYTRLRLGHGLGWDDCELQGSTLLGKC
jgi:hypothetical protein